MVNDEGEALVIDFGYSRALEFTDQTSSSSFGGTPRWMAPELISPEPDEENGDTGEAEEQSPLPRLTLATDVWASSMTVLEVGYMITFPLVHRLSPHIPIRYLRGSFHSITFPMVQPSLLLSSEASVLDLV
jgi:serine/threonine protein kinase